MFSNFVVLACGLCILFAPSTRSTPEVRSEPDGNMTLSVGSHNDVFVEQMSSGSALPLRSSILSLLDRVTSLEARISQTMTRTDIVSLVGNHSAVQVTASLLPCNASRLGQIVFHTSTNLLKICNGASWEQISQDPIGSVGNPGPDCEQIRLQLGSYVSAGTPYFVVFKGLTVQHMCNFSVSPAVSVGGDGGTPTTAALSCAQLRGSGGYIPGNMYYVADPRTGGASVTQLTEDTPIVQVVCNPSNATYDGTAVGLPAESCASTRMFDVNAGSTAGLFYVYTSPTQVVRLLCDLAHPDGVSLGGDGSSPTTASTSCASIQQHNTASGAVSYTGVYWVQAAGAWSSAPVQVVCNMTGATAMSLGGNGTANSTTSFSCDTIQRFFDAPSGNYYVDTDGNMATGIDVVFGFCDMSRTPALLLGGDGTSRFHPGHSCMSIYEIDPSSTGPRWIVVPGVPAAVQVYCDQSDGGGWMKILQIGSNPIYLPTPASAGDGSWSNTSAFAKLADTVPNSIIPTGATRVYRMSSNPAWSSLSVYFRTTRNFTDTARYWNVVASSTTEQYCSVDGGFEDCTWSTSPTKFDTYGQGSGFLHRVDTQQRMFTDLSEGASGCYNARCSSLGYRTLGTCRCVNAGFRPAPGSTHWAPIPYFSLWVRYQAPSA
eukprot:m.311481 g.311481  ORF g.311481 m.311481 type:complete len:657 (-) comp20222_c0_seq1:142-2112(-)